jgi:hypothetical protein
MPHHKTKDIRSLPDIVYHADRILIPGTSRSDCTYLPNHAFAGEHIDAFHDYLAHCPTRGRLIDIGIAGWLSREDALKIYELGYFGAGDIIEFGTNEGLSTAILAMAMIASGRPGRVVTIELHEELALQASDNLGERDCDEPVDFLIGDADTVCAHLIDQKKSFGFAFVDHSHAYEHVVAACRRLDALLVPGAFCAFHDYNDPRNTLRRGVGESPEEYGVQAGVADGLDPARFEFAGIYGCTGLFRKK